MQVNGDSLLVSQGILVCEVLRGLVHLDQSGHLLFIWVRARSDTQEENIGKREISNEAFWGSIDRSFLC